MQSIAVDETGNVHVVHDAGFGNYKKKDAHNIHTYSPDGTLIVKWGLAGDKDEEFVGSNALDISIDPNTGHIYITDSCNKYDCRKHKKRIQVFNPF